LDHQDDLTDNYLNFNKNASLKARLFNKNSQLIISSLNSSSNGDINFSDILGTKDDFLNQVLNDNQSKNDNNNLIQNSNSFFGSKLISNNGNNINESFLNMNNNDNIINKSNINNISHRSSIFQDKATAVNAGDYNILKSSFNRNTSNNFSLLNNINNDQGSTISQYSKSSSIFGDENNSAYVEDLNYNFINAGKKFFIYYYII